MIDLSRIDQSTLREKPYQWALIDRVFSTKDAQRLTRSYPHDHFKTVDGYDGEKGYKYEVRSLIGMGAVEPSHSLGLSPVWRRLAIQLLSAEYRQAMSRLTGQDLASLPIEVNVFHFGPGDWQGPHLDLEDKIATHILYFNQGRHSDEGGFFKVLGSKNPDDVSAEIPPVVGNSVVVVRSDRSWHMVSRVAERSSTTRRSVTVTFYRPGSISTMWPPGDTTPLHFAPAHADPGPWHRLTAALGRRVRF